jgi:hypothetical protein
MKYPAGESLYFKAVLGFKIPWYQKIHLKIYCWVSGRYVPK